MSHAATHNRLATADAPILDVVAERWSTRVFDAAAPLDEAAFASALEAARWAPSAQNTQPTRFIVGRRGSDVHTRIFDALMGFNQAWANDAAALVVVVADTVSAEGKALRWAEYDAGQAAAYFTVQAHSGGLFTHQMGGFRVADIHQAFDLDENSVPLTVIAVGALGDVDAADNALRERELAPRTRRSVDESLLAND